jgi:CRISPR-associated endonuclease Cas1
VTGLDVSLACYLIAEKLHGQRANLPRLQVKDFRAFDGLREALKHAGTIEDVRICEAQAAAIYWNAWRTVPLRLRGRDLARTPAHWARYDSRASVLTGAPRAATNPVNALLNYLYVLLESEARLALLSVGLDPTLGVLHADQRNRDSFALDAMEPIRPAVDAFVLDPLLNDAAHPKTDTPCSVGNADAIKNGAQAPTSPPIKKCLRLPSPLQA